jgi:hypothetical protein
MTSRCFTGVLVAGLAFGYFACDESLPPRDNPDVVLIPSMKVTAGVVSVDRYGNTTGGNVVLQAINVYDEALSEKQGIRGIVALRLKGLTQTIIYTSADLQSARMLSGNTLTVLPKDTVVLLHLWDHITDRDVPFWNVLAFSRKTTPNGQVYYESEPADISITATLQLFERVPAVRLPPTQVRIIYRMENKPPDNPARIPGVSDTREQIHQN